MLPQEDRCRVITVEEHNIIGGLGEAVSTALSEHCTTPVTRIGVNDVYGHSGPAVDLLKEFGPFRRAYCRGHRKTAK